MNIRILLVIIGSILFLQSCAPKARVKGVVSPDQKIGYDGTVTSKKRHFVALSTYDKLKAASDKTMFMIDVENGGKEPIRINKDNISVIFKGNTKGWFSKRIKIQSPDEFLDNLEQELLYKEKSLIFNELVEILRSEQDNIGTYVVVIASPFLKDLDQIWTEIKDLNYDVEDMRNDRKLLQEVMPETIMKPQTIMPYDRYSGIVVCDTRDMDPEIEGNFEVVVSIDGEEHRFTLVRNILKSKNKRHRPKPRSVFEGSRKGGFRVIY